MNDVIKIIKSITALRKNATRTNIKIKQLEEGKYYSPEVLRFCGWDLRYLVNQKIATNIFEEKPDKIIRLKDILIDEQTEKLKDFSLLDEKEEEVKYLDLGEINGRWYYGNKTNAETEFLIFSDKTIEIDEYQCPVCNFITTNPLQKICLCGRKGAMLHLFPKQFKADGYIGNIAPLWEKKAVKEFLTNTKKLCKRTIYKQIRDLIVYFMDLGEKEIIADVQACWIIATYCYPLFYWFPHILFKAPSNSGKSKNAYIMIQLAFRGFDLGASGGVTPAQIFRTLEGNRGTIRVDEFEQRMNSESQIIVNQILNASASRESYIIRNEKINDKWVAKKFPIFCPKVACNISGINQTSLSRYIVFELFKSVGEKSKRKPEKLDEKIKFNSVRNDLYNLMMDEWQNIKKIAEKTNIKELSGRDEDNWFAICVIAKWLGEDVLQNVLKYIQDYKDIAIENNDEEEILFQKIYSHFNSSDELNVTPKKIAEWMGDELSHNKSPSRWVGWKLKKYNLKQNRGRDGRVYNLKKSIISNILNTYFQGSVNNDNNDINVNNDNNDNNDNNVNNDNKNVDVVDVVDVVTKVNTEESVTDFYPFDQKKLWNLPCSICKESPCNKNDYGLPICEKHWQGWYNKKVMGNE